VHQGLSVLQAGQPILLQSLPLLFRSDRPVRDIFPG